MKKIMLATLWGCLWAVTAGMAFVGPGPDAVVPTRRAAAPAEPARPPATGLLDALLADRVLGAGLEEVAFSPEGSRLWSLWGRLSEPVRGDRAAAGREFLLSRRRLFNLPGWAGTDWLRLCRNETAAGATHLAFSLCLDGVPVDGARIDLHIGRDGRLQLITGSFPDLPEVYPAPHVDRDEAIARALAATRTTRLRSGATARKVFLIGPGREGLGWRVDLPSAEPVADLVVDVAAADGTVLGWHDRIAWMTPAPERFTGQGSIYRHNPQHGRPEVAPLPYLASQTLLGAFAHVRNDDGPAAISPEGNYLFEPTDTHFDEPHVYFHLNRVHDFFRAMGFTAMDRVARAWVHYGTRLDNAFYSPSEDKIRFGDGDRFNDFAREEAVVYHEYAHAVLHRIVDIEYAGESGAMNEGQADYFAASLSDDPAIGEWVAAKAGKPFLRTLDNSLHYPEDCTNEVHDDGRIWGGTLWDLRRALGAGVTDRLVHGGHFYLKPDVSWFRDGMVALLTADRNLNGGRNEAVIRSVFQRRGIVGVEKPGRILSAADLQVLRSFRRIHGD